MNCIRCFLSVVTLVAFLYTNKHRRREVLKKVLLICTTVLLFVGALWYFITQWQRFDPNDKLLALHHNIILNVTGLELVPSATTTTEKKYATDDQYTYVVKDGKEVGTFTITVRTLDNDDQFVFYHLTNTTDQPLEGTLQIGLPTKTYTFKPFKTPTQPEHDRVYGPDETSSLKGLLRADGKDVLFSQNFISHRLVEKYEDGTTSTLKDLVKEEREHTLKQRQQHAVMEIPLQTPAKNDESEGWLLIGSKSLLEDDKEFTFFDNYMADYYINAPKWLTADGAYTKLPWSIEPTTKLGYGRKLIGMQQKNIALRYETNPERLYYDLLINATNYLLDYKTDTDIWPTEYTSTWLKNDYGIKAPYLDTRHNENIALFLRMVGTFLNDKDLQESDQLYGNYLVAQQTVGNVFETKNGYYILDYYAESQTKKTHVSLNHAFGEMTFLFKLYEDTGKQAYLDTALQIKNAFEDTGLAWQNPNGDLWYQINGDGSFEGQDYDVLTLTDFINVLDYYKKLNIPYDRSLYDTLIRSKIQFLMAEEIVILRSVKEDLLRLGYTEIKDYTLTKEYEDDAS